MDWLQPLCNIIILVGGAFAAFKTICELLGKPIRLVRKRVDNDFETRVTEVVLKILPDILYKHDIETRDKYRADRERYLEEIKTEVLKSIKGELTQVNNLAEQYEALAISAKDVLREKIMAVYHKNVKDKTLTYSEKEALDQYYKDYKKIKGNSYIDKYYARMCTWQVNDDEEYV